MVTENIDFQIKEGIGYIPGPTPKITQVDIIFTLVAENILNDLWKYLIAQMVRELINRAREECLVSMRQLSNHIVEYTPISKIKAAKSHLLPKFLELAISIQKTIFDSCTSSDDITSSF